MLLSGYRVLDLTGPLGSLCGKILGDLGADVIKIEPPGGDPDRHSAPVLEAQGAKHSLSWLASNANKRGITLNLRCTAGQEAFLKLAKTTDFILESFPPGAMEKWGVGY